MYHNGTVVGGRKLCFIRCYGREDGSDEVDRRMVAAAASRRGSFAFTLPNLLISFLLPQDKAKKASWPDKFHDSGPALCSNKEKPLQRTYNVASVGPDHGQKPIVDFCLFKVRLVDSARIREHEMGTRHSKVGHGVPDTALK